MIMSNRKSSRLLPEGYIPSQYDIVCGRGKGMYQQQGNGHFRAIVAAYARYYESLKRRSDKQIAIHSVLALIRSQNDGEVRFVRRWFPTVSKRTGGNPNSCVHDKTCRWEELADTEIREKVSNALRAANSLANANDRNRIVNASCSKDNVPHIEMNVQSVKLANNLQQLQRLHHQQQQQQLQQNHVTPLQRPYLVATKHGKVTNPSPYAGVPVAMSPPPNSFFQLGPQTVQAVLNRRSVDERSPLLRTATHNIAQRNVAGIGNGTGNVCYDTSRVVFPSRDSTRLAPNFASVNTTVSPFTMQAKEDKNEVYPDSHKSYYSEHENTSDSDDDDDDNEDPPSFHELVNYYPTATTQSASADVQEDDDTKKIVALTLLDLSH